MEPAAIKLVQALIDEEAMSSCEHASAYGKQEYWNRVTTTLDCTYHEHCEARGLPPTMFQRSFREFIYLLEDAWFCLTLPSHAAARLAVAYLQAESKARRQFKSKRIVEDAVGGDVTSDADALAAALDKMIPKNLKPVATRVQRVYVPKASKAKRLPTDFVCDKIVRAFLDLQSLRHASIK